MNRDQNIDLVKGVCIILMVMGHAGAPFRDFIYLFHMAVFFIVAGYLYNTKYSDSFPGVMSFWIKRLNSLYKPFVLWNIFYLLLNNIFIKYNIYTDNPLFLLTVEGKDRGISSILSVADIFNKSLGILTFGSRPQLSSASWFLVVLFSISILYASIEYVIKKITNKPKIYHGFISMLFLLFGFYLSSRGISLPREASITFSVYFLFYIGVVFRGVDFKSISVRGLIVILICSFLILIVCNKVGTIELSHNSYKNPVYLLFSSISGWFFVYSVVALLPFLKLRFYLSYIGRNTLPILFLHFLSFKLITFLLWLLMVSQIT